MSHIFSAGHRRHDRVPHPPGATPKPRNGLEGIARGSGCVLGGKGGHQLPLSRRDILRIARRLNAGKHRAWHTSPEGTAEGWAVGLDLSRPFFGTRALSASAPALKTLGYSRLSLRDSSSPPLNLTSTDNTSLPSQSEVSPKIGRRLSSAPERPDPNWCAQDWRSIPG